jgi:hypothetical protein
LIAERLFRSFDEEVRRWRFDSSALEKQETVFTGTVLLPRVHDWIRTLGHRSLSLRADGGSPPGSLTVAGMEFVPDMEFWEYESKLLAIEVKFLRDTDPSGSLAKSIGQASLYRALGFRFSYVFIVDCRNRALQIWGGTQSRRISLPAEVGLVVFGNKNGELVALATTGDLEEQERN